jgi:ketosteroid isomerase-like protein
LVVSASACSERFQSHAQASGLSPADDEYLRSAAHVWDSLFNAQDVAGLAAMFDDDVVAKPADHPTIHGKMPYVGRLITFFAENTGTHKADVTEILMGKDWCIERADYELAYSPRPFPNEVLVRKGTRIVCRKKVNGEWLITWVVRSREQPQALLPGD